MLKSKRLRVLLSKKHRKLIFSFLILTFSLSCLVGLEAYRSFNAEISDSLNDSNNLSFALEADISASFKNIDLILTHLQSELNRFDSISLKHTSEFNHLVLDNKSKSEDILSFKVINNLGEYVGDDSLKISSKNLRDRDYYNYYLKNPVNELFISKPIISKTMGIWVIALVRPLLDKNNKFNGLILATISLAKFKEKFEQLNVGKGMVVLYDYDGYLYARHPWTEDKIGKIINERSAKTLFEQLNNIVTIKNEISPIDKIFKVSTFRKFKKYPFTIGVGFVRQEILNEWSRRLLIQLAGLFSILIAGMYILSSYLVSQEIFDEQRRQSIQATKMNSLGEMASGIAHEINNPLTVIYGLSTQIKKSIGTDNFSEEKSKEQLSKIIATVDRIAKIIKGLRNFARDSFDDPFIKISLSEIIKTTIELTRSKIIDNQISMQVDNIPEINISCREVQIVQVFINLISNAIDAIALLEQKWIRLKFDISDNIIKISFIDSGQGIPEDEQDKIMQPFFTTKEIGKGTGLGLSISKGIIDDHDGKLIIDTDSENTCFIIELPII